jgi:hypothetical protein
LIPGNREGTGFDGMMKNETKWGLSCVIGVLCVNAAEEQGCIFEDQVASLRLHADKVATTPLKVWSGLKAFRAMDVERKFGTCTQRPYSAYPNRYGELQ